MRAVVLGLVGVLLAAGGAQAGECTVSSPMVASARAQWASDIKRPDLVGKTFTVEKIASEWVPAKKGGYIASLVATETEKFVTIQSRSGPADWSESFDAADPAVGKISWGKRDPRIERLVLNSLGVISDSGPLVHLYLAPKC